MNLIMFKPILKNAEEITDFIKEFATDSIDEELVREYFDGCKAILKLVKVSGLFEGEENQNAKDVKKEKNYEMLPIKNMPPLIVENDIVRDGNHRIRIAKRNNLEEIFIYDILLIEA